MTTSNEYASRAIPLEPMLPGWPKRKPCPICGKTRVCRSAGDRYHDACRRVANRRSECITDTMMEGTPDLSGPGFGQLERVKRKADEVRDSRSPGTADGTDGSWWQRPFKYGGKGGSDG